MAGTLIELQTVLILPRLMKMYTALLLFVVVAASCRKETQPMTKQEVQHKIDSLTELRLKEIDQQANHDLEYRMKIEVRAKVDSIVQARSQRLGNGVPAH